MRTMGNMKKSITADSDFAAWAAARSQKTNRSLAGARLAIPEPQKHAEIKSQAQQWGMTVEDATMTDEHNEEFLCDGTQSIDSITDMRKASGLEAMEYAEQHMPVLRDTMDSLTTRVDFSGIRIAVCLILEPKTAILLRKLKAAGAIVGVYCGPDSTDPRVAEQLRREGITVESSRDWTAEQAHEAALHLLDEIQPDIIIDDGASFARLASLERPELTANLIGVAEETTSGVRAFQQMQEAGALTYPVVAVNDSVLKTGFDNAHGTGETCVTMHSTVRTSPSSATARSPKASHGAFARLAPKSPSAISIQWLHSKRCSTASPHKTLTRHSLARIWWCPPLA